MAKKKKMQDAELLPLRTSHDDLPTTVGMVKHVRLELRADIRGIQHDMKAMEKRMTGRMDTLDGKVEQVISAVNRVQVIVEEQRSESRIVMDGLTTIIERMNRHDAQIDEFRHTLQIFIKAKESPAH